LLISQAYSHINKQVQNSQDITVNDNVANNRNLYVYKSHSTKIKSITHLK
jgi:hypothetical protein